MAAAALNASANRDYARGLARAFGGAILFAFPLLMTMEMWWLGFSMAPGRLALFLILNFLMLVPLAHFVGFEETGSTLDNILDALAAFAVGVLASALMLGLFAILGPGMPADELIGKVAVQSVPASIGAIVARGQLGGEGDYGQQQEKQERAGYPGQLLIMIAGAVFLAFNVAPTEEMILIAFRMSPLHSILLVVFSILILHAFVYAVGFRGQERGPSGGVHAFFVYTLVGYGIALLISLYVLWTFGRTDGAAASEIARMVAVLGFPSVLGAAAARLLL